MKRIIYFVLLLCCSVAASAKDPDPELLKKAEAGDAKAQYEIAIFYLPNSEAVNAEGLKWLIKAGENGHAQAQWNLHRAYYYGWHGLSKNDEQYVYWLKKLAQNPYPDKFTVPGTQYELGELYYSGKHGVEKNISEYLKWAKKAAYNGYASAAYSLGLYYQGEGDKQEAIYWFKKCMDLTWAKLKEEDEDAFKELKKLGVTYHPADHVGHNHAEAVATTSSQGGGNQVQEHTEMVPVQVWQACGACNGSGQCGVCYGSGWIYSNNSYNGRRSCTACHGTGKCTSCAGHGGQNVVRYEQRKVYR